MLKEVRGRDFAGRIREGTFWGDGNSNVLYLDRGLGYMKNLTHVQLRSVHIIICKFCLKRQRCKFWTLVNICFMYAEVI